MAMSWSKGTTTLEDFIEEDLPFLVKSHYEDTLIFLKKQLSKSNISFEEAITQYPNLLSKIQYHLFFWFAQQMSTVQSNENKDFYAHYSLVAKAYRDRYVRSFVDKQIKELKEKLNNN